jgi:hypothetical protein
MITSESQQKLDQNWYQRLVDIAPLTGDQLDDTNESRTKEMERFLNNEVENPTLNYPKLKMEELKDREARYLELKADILSKETNPVVAQTYRWKLNENIASNRKLQAVLNGDMHKFKRYSEFLDGNPSMEIFSYNVAILRRRLEKEVSSDDPNIKSAARDLLAVLPMNLPDSGIEIVSGSEEILDRVEQSIKGQFGSVLELDEDIKYAPDAVRDTLEEAVKQVGGDDWNVVIDYETSKTAVSVKSLTKEVIVPSKKAPISAMMLKKLIAHEVGGHVARSINGERSKLILLRLGLDRDDRGEEGVAVLNEQAVKRNLEIRISEPYVSIGLAYGLDGTPRDFRGVFEVLKKYHMFMQLKEGKTVQEAREISNERAWNRCVRTFKGTDCKTKGVCSTNDMAYGEGNIAIWRLLKKDSSALLKFSLGKYDPTNERHLWVLSQLGISDDDLSQLEQPQQTA